MTAAVHFRAEPQPPTGAAHARRHDRDKSILPGGLRRAQGRGVPPHGGSEGVWRGGPDARAGVARNAASRALRAGHGAVHQHAQLLGGRRGRPRGAAATSRCEWILKEAAAGEVFAAGHAEHGNDIPGLLSTTKAERVDGGCKFTGRKAFGSLTPVWTRLGLHGWTRATRPRRRSSTRSCRATRRAARSRRPGT